jgi:hypothetical protein
MKIVFSTFQDLSSGYLKPQKYTRLHTRAIPDDLKNVRELPARKPTEAFFFHIFTELE